MTNQILITSIDGATTQRSAGPAAVESVQAERNPAKSFRDVMQSTDKGHDSHRHGVSEGADNTSKKKSLNSPLNEPATSPSTELAQELVILDPHTELPGRPLAVTVLEDDVQGDWILLDELPESLALTEAGAEVLSGVHRLQWRAAGDIPLQQNSGAASLDIGGEQILVDEKAILPFAQSTSKSNKLTPSSLMPDATTAELSTDRNTQFTLRSSTLLPPGGWQMQGEAVTKDLLLQQRHLDANFNSVTETDFHIPFGSEAISASGEPALGTPMLDDTLSTGFKGRIQIPLNMQFSHSQWSNGVAEKTAALISQNINSAEIQMDPPELGPLQVRIQVHQDQASVTFVTANPQVRDALDASLLRLKDMLQEQGLQLVDSGVSDQSAEEKQQHSGSSSGSGEPLGGPLGSQEDADETEVSSSGVVHWGVDYFA